MGVIADFVISFLTIINHRFMGNEIYTANKKNKNTKYTGCAKT